ncbi:MAG: hypothetical protein KF744_14405 [Taibaiella sp.]|nr:hypothetical protein [Taibaiella sp.]
MSQVLIVSKTQMFSGICVGGLQLDNNRSVRLMSPGVHNYQPINTPFNIGEIWEIEFHNHPTIENPHVEDVIVDSSRLIQTNINVGDLILQRNLINYRGAITNVFGGTLKWTKNGSGYIPQNGPFPDRSVGFWISDHDINLHDSHDKHKYGYPVSYGYQDLSYVGLQQPVPYIAAGTIIRVSLSRLFPKPGQPNPHNTPYGYYLQLSGWYTGTVRPTPAPETIDDLPF